MLITSNFPPDVLSNKIGKKLMSRILEYNEPIEIDENKDWR